MHLHGGAGRWHYSIELLDALGEQWHVFAPDFRGHGKSGHIPGTYRLVDYVRDIAAFIDGVVREPAVIYGHSLGGEVSVMLAAQQPRLVRALIVGDSPLSTRNHLTEEPTHHARNELWHSLAGQPVAKIEEALRETPVLEAVSRRKTTARELMGENNPWFAYQAISLHQLDPDMLAAVLAGPETMLAGYDPYVLLPQIECPVLLLQADALHGSAMSDDEVELALQLLRQPTHVKMVGIGHPLHGPPGMTPRILHVMEAFLSAL